MRVFVGNLSSPLGTEIARCLRSCEVVGAVENLKQAQATKKRLVENRDPELGDGLEGPDAFVESPVVAANDKHSVSVLLKRCHVAIYSILDDPDATLEALKAFADGADDGPKLFVAVSSVLTWAKTPVPPKNDEWKGHKEADFKTRKPARKYAEYKAVETQVLSARREGLATLVVAAGMIYGGAHSSLHYLLREAWLNTDADLIVPSVSGLHGANKLPMINLYDLARIVAKVATAPGAPSAPYMLAVDKAQSTLRDVCGAISGALGNGNLRDLSSAEAEELLLVERSMVHLQLDQVFDMEGSALDGLDIEWQCQGGLVANIDAVVQDYIKCMDLRPVRVVLLGPPRVGKSTLAAALAKAYYLPHLTPASVALELLNTAKLEEPLLTLKEEVKRYKLELVNLPVALATELLRWRLSAPVCRNQGYVLDGAPVSVEQAKALFPPPKPDDEAKDTDADADESKDADDDAPKPTKPKKPTVYAPNRVVCLSAPKLLLQRRAQSLSQDEAEKTGNTEIEFAKRYDVFQREKAPDGGAPGLLAFFERDAALEVLELDLKTEEAFAAKKTAFEPVTKYVETGGKPFNYHPTKEELLQQQRDTEATLAAEAEAEQKRQSDVLAQELSEKQLRAQTEKSRLEIIQKEEMDVLEARSKPLRAYLMETVIPALTEGMLEVVKVQPDDPIDYLADFLFKKGQSLEV
ncbi:adenylate kinase [Achlya hypogyna]|uniref:Adenylate kinase n=1 Tax=Achlya hypogyna TaxID=1202772 RepID=A0A1V9ZH92_ACHHY|nr:adenylate kinase [Achlya hypogyna]